MLPEIDSPEATTSVSEEPANIPLTASDRRAARTIVGLMACALLRGGPRIAREVERVELAPAQRFARKQKRKAEQHSRAINRRK